jgi:hypothetical protein
MCLPVSRLFWVSSLAYPNLLGTKDYVVVVVVVKLERDTRLSIQFQNVSATSKTGYSIFIAKPPTKANITAYGPSQPVQALLRSKPKPKDKRPSLPALLHFVRPLSVSSDPCDVIQAPEPCNVIQAPEPCNVIKAVDPFAQLLLRSTPYCNTLLRAHTGPYLFLLRNRPPTVTHCYGHAQAPTFSC